ncbi:MAG: hypothetical protein ACFCU4_05070 [Puniceicoccaceae bacterium]
MAKKFITLSAIGLFVVATALSARSLRPPSGGGPVVTDPVVVISPN